MRNWFLFFLSFERGKTRVADAVDVQPFGMLDYQPNRLIG